MMPTEFYEKKFFCTSIIPALNWAYKFALHTFKSDLSIMTKPIILECELFSELGISFHTFLFICFYSFCSVSTQYCYLLRVVLHVVLTLSNTSVTLFLCFIFYVEMRRQGIQTFSINCGWIFRYETYSDHDSMFHFFNYSNLIT